MLVMNFFIHAVNLVTEYLKLHLGYVLRLNSWKEDLLLFTYLITLCKDVTFPLFTEFKTNKYLELFICKSNSELKCGLTNKFMI